MLEREVYEVGEAARLLGLHVRTLRNWLEGYSARGKSYPPVLRKAATGSDLLTWGEFVEAGYLAEYRRAQKVPLPRIRDYIEAWRARLGVPYPLAHQQPYVGPDHDLMDSAETEGGDTIMYRFRDGQLTMTPWAREFFHKIDFEHQIAQRIWPDGKDQRVVIDPQRAFGAPTVDGVRTEVLYEMFVAGDLLADIAADYDLDREAVEAAIRFESPRPKPEIITTPAA